MGAEAKTGRWLFHYVKTDVSVESTSPDPQVLVGALHAEPNVSALNV